MSFFLYADDAQLFLEFNVSVTISVHEVTTRHQGCVAWVRSWMQASMLKLKEEKTELLAILPRSAQPCTFSIAVGDAVIQPPECARNLGVTFDHAMSLQQNVESLCLSAFYQLRCIGRIRCYLDVDSSKRLVHALVLTRLDCCNGFLNGIPQALVSKLQRVQNATLGSCCTEASMVTWLPCSSSFTGCQSNCPYSWGSWCWHSNAFMSRSCQPVVSCFITIHKPRALPTLCRQTPSWPARMSCHGQSEDTFLCSSVPLE